MAAIARIDAALARIETASARPDDAGGSTVVPGDPELEARHRRLRAVSEDAIARLDRLIEAEGTA